MFGEVAVMVGEEFISDKVASTTLFTLDAYVNVSKHLSESDLVTIKQIRANYIKAIQLCLFMQATLNDSEAMNQIVDLKEYLLAKKESIYSPSARLSTYFKLGVLYCDDEKGIKLNHDELMDNLIIPTSIIVDELNLQSIFGGYDSSFDWPRKREPVYDFLLSRSELLNALRYYKLIQTEDSLSNLRGEIKKLFDQAGKEIRAIDGLGSKWCYNQDLANKMFVSHMNEIGELFFSFICDGKNLSYELSIKGSDSADIEEYADKLCAAIDLDIKNNKANEGLKTSLASGKGVYNFHNFILLKLQEQYLSTKSFENSDDKMQKISFFQRRLLNLCIRYMQSFYDPGVDNWVQKNRYLALDRKAASNSRAYQTLGYIARTPIAILLATYVIGLIIAFICVFIAGIKESSMPFCIMFLHIKGLVSTEKARPAYIVTLVTFLVVLSLTIISAIAVRCLMISDRKRCSSECMVGYIVKDLVERVKDPMSYCPEDIDPTLNSIATSILAQDHNFLSALEDNVAQENKDSTLLSEKARPLSIDAQSGRAALLHNIRGPSIGANECELQKIANNVKKSDIKKVESECDDVLKKISGSSRSFEDKVKEFWNVTPNFWTECSRGERSLAPRTIA